MISMGGPGAISPLQTAQAGQSAEEWRFHRQGWCGGGDLAERVRILHIDACGEAADLAARTRKLSGGSRRVDEFL
jgi:hypothetical protein